MITQLRNPRLYVMLAIDAVIFTLACVGAYLLRFEFVLSKESLRQIRLILPCIVVSKLLIFFLFGLYKGMWRYSGLRDFWRLAQACFFSMLLIITLVLFIHNFQGFSRAVFLLDAVLTFVMAGGLRMGIRSYFAASNGSSPTRIFSIPSFRTAPKNGKRILIIGAGGSGEKILREIFDNPQIQYSVVGFLDDDPGKQGRAVHGIPVFGGVDALPEILEKYTIDQVIISVPSATGPQMRRIVDTCKSCRIPYKTLPAIGEIIDGRVSVKALRDVSYEDLLRRPPVELDTTGIRDYLSGRTILVTGAGGSIGSELCRQLVRFDPGELILVDSGEANLYGIHMELRHELRYSNYKCVLGRAQNEKLIGDLFRNYRPQIVFHAAAYKHVPLLERNPWEAVFNNIVGTKVVMEQAQEHDCGRFVLVSTDKAVRPTNVMGTSKRLTELIMLSLQGSGTRYMAVRFGNVVGSSGSVIPLFRRQIEQGGPVTVTHPEMTRYFMTIPEAAQLILQAGAFAEGGEIFVLEMGTPVKIADMAEDLIRLSGKEPGRDIEIKFTGLRAGEKLYEELITHGEDIARTRHEKIMVLQSNGRWNWNGHGDRQAFRSTLYEGIQELCTLAAAHNPCTIKQKLQQLVPEYTPQETECVL